MRGRERFPGEALVGQYRGELVLQVEHQRDRRHRVQAEGAQRCVRRQLILRRQVPQMPPEDRDKGFVHVASFAGTGTRVSSRRDAATTLSPSTTTSTGAG